MKADLSAAEVRAILSYDPETGRLIWRRRAGSCPAGTVAGCVSRAHGYRVVGIGGRLFQAHRLAFLIETGRWPTELLDHVNGIRDDNRWLNIREADSRQNAANSRIRRDNASGFKGVHRVKGRWRAMIRLDGASRHIGYFQTKAGAATAYRAAAEKARGEFARFE